MGSPIASPGGTDRTADQDLENLTGSGLRPEKKRIRRLYRNCPKGAAVVCFDEWGPLELRPVGGVAWARKGQPVRRRATYRRLKGTEQFLAFYDVHADCLNGIFRRQKRIPDLFQAFRRLRACYPRRQLFVILDNLHNIHDHPRFLAHLRLLGIKPVFTPTEASWLNLIEAQFGVLKRFTLANTDDLDHRLRRRRIYRYLRYRHLKLDNRAHPLNRLRTVRPVKLEWH
jgi:hypothetical protein